MNKQTETSRLLASTPRWWYERTTIYDDEIRHTYVRPKREFSEKKGEKRSSSTAEDKLRCGKKKTGFPNGLWHTRPGDAETKRPC